MSKRKYCVAIVGYVIVLLLLASGCTSATNVASPVSTTSSASTKVTTINTVPNSNEEDLLNARAALTKFFALLHEREYSEATRYYGGSYEVLRNWNPIVDENDYATLLKHGCEQNGLECMPVRRIINEKNSSQDTFEFTIEFTARNGGVFVRGPFPGETKDQATRHFNYIVKKLDNRFLVQEPPPYVP